MWFKYVTFFSSLTIISCAQDNDLIKHDFPNHESIQIINCRKLVDITEGVIAKAGVKDVQEVRIEKHPYLRINRFLSSFRKELNGQNFLLWLEQLQHLGLLGWEIELNNLPLEDKIQLETLTANLLPEAPSVLSKLSSCSEKLSRFELILEVDRNKLKQAAIVPSAYNTWQQVFGLYPLTAIPFRIGIYRWHQETLGVFNRTLDSLPVKGELVLYAPETKITKLNRENVAEILQSSAENALAIPLLSGIQQQQLFDTFAPGFEIDIVSDNDRIGEPYWGDDSNGLLDTNKPVVYRHISHTRMGDKTLLQLNYSIWFSSRPKTSAFDLLGGNLDGIIWRVTLSPDGNPLVFDSIHACGCYHFFFPTQYAQVLKSNALFKEPVFTPQDNFIFNHDQNVIVRVGANNHYIQKIYTAPVSNAPIKNYRFDHADSLRSLPLQNSGARSLYNHEGFIKGSERGERFLFWPMGVSNPGAMRQWGQHATAFVGRRHFDDARLFEGSFEWIGTHKE